jgi:hypothetical protein
MTDDEERLAMIRESFAGYRVVPYIGPPATPIMFTIADAARVLGLMSWPAESRPIEPPETEDGSPAGLV